MSKFVKKKGNEDVPAISTASLPDIVFMLLFFFMVATTMRDNEMKLDNVLPKADQTNKLDKKERAKRIPTPEEALIAALKVDKNSKMGLVSEVKKKLRESGQYKVNYVTNKGSVVN